MNRCGEGAGTGPSSSEAERPAIHSSGRDRAIGLRPARARHAADILQRPDEIGRGTIAGVLNTKTQSHRFIGIDYTVRRFAAFASEA